MFSFLKSKNSSKKETDTKAHTCAPKATSSWGGHSTDGGWDAKPKSGANNDAEAAGACGGGCGGGCGGEGGCGGGCGGGK
ncbi:Protein of unknown function [Pyronema omphalodes CBS 100304]|uniref:Uncharacterized protein n=1 Tax=Pyronema omphalodes (strain CBS 100304) TaxID=1076935 RepID=U4LD17_PYROM|nr:Protein of unknown function [Pyronema omphalodes CBS 100304]